MKTILTITLLFTCVLGFGQQQVFKSPRRGDTIYYDPSNPPQVFKGGVEYAINFSLPASLPKTNLLGYWDYSYGINAADSTFYTVDASNNPVDTFKLYDVDFDITLGYIPLKSACYFKVLSDIGDTIWAGGNVKLPIYPTTVFQNIDYDSIRFFKKEAHVINADSTELHPARITEIALYSQASDAMAYFEVPTFTNPIWIDPIAGNDATGNGTRATPYKTVIGVEALSSLGAGRDILVMSGSETATTYFGATDPYNWTAIGRYKLNAGSTQAILFLGDNVHVSNFILNGNELTYANLAQTNLTGLSLSNVFCSGGTYFMRDLSSALTIHQCVSTNVNFYRNQNATNTIIINESYHSNTGGGLYTNATIATATNTKITYNKDIGSAITMNGSGSYQIKYNDTKNLLNTTNGIYTGIILIKGNTMRPTITSGKLLGTPNSSTVDYNWKVINNKVTFAAGTGGTFFIAVDQKNILLEDNVIDGSQTDIDFSFAQINNPTVRNISDTIRNNYWSRYHISDAVVLQIGNETYGSGDGNLNWSFISENSFIGSGNYQDNTGGSHAVFITRTINTKLINNYIEGFNIGIVFKSQTQVDSSGGAFYNLIKDCRGGLLAKGYDSTKFIGNTVLMTKRYLGANYGIGLIYNTEADSTSQGCEVKNNIVCDLTTENAETGCFLIDSLNHDINNNVVYTLNNSISLEAATWPEWTAFGFDANSYNQNPSLTSATQLWPITPFTGVNLGTAYDDGLDISTTWGSATTVPNIVTKQQGATWQIGAYIK